MGYRSDVAAGIRREDCRRLFAAAHKESLRPSNPKKARCYDENGSPEDFLASAVVTEHDRGSDGLWTTLKWLNIKWYPQYEAVKFIESFLKGLDEYQYIRFGDDVDDVEVRDTSPVWLIDTRREIIVVP